MSDIETLIAEFRSYGITKHQRECLEQYVWLIRDAKVVRKLQWLLAVAPNAQESICDT